MVKKVRTKGVSDSRQKGHFPNLGFFQGRKGDDEYYDALVESDAKYVYINRGGWKYKVPRKHVTEDKD
jgi:hypothetical protein